MASPIKLNLWQKVLLICLAGAFVGGGCLFLYMLRFTTYLGDHREILRTGSPTTLYDGSNQPGTCWTCKGPDVPRLMEEVGPEKFMQEIVPQWLSIAKENSKLLDY